MIGFGLGTNSWTNIQPTSWNPDQERGTDMKIEEFSNKTAFGRRVSPGWHQVGNKVVASCSKLSLRLHEGRHFEK